MVLPESIILNDALKKEDLIAVSDGKKGFVYVIKSGDFYKIGKCTLQWTVPLSFKTPLSRDRIIVGILSDLGGRFNGYYTHNPHDIELFGAALVANCDSLEKFIHNYFSRYRWRGEWFKLPKTQVNKLRSILKKSV